MQPDEHGNPTASGGLTVQLRRATLPTPLRRIALHHWFVVLDPAEASAHRWEVWQNRDAGGMSWGFLHRDLMHPDRPVGGGPAVIAGSWAGEEARRLAAVLGEPDRYPHRLRYLAWPGPNSNTYARWVLDEAAIQHELDPRAIGKDFLGRTGAGVAAGNGVVRAGCPLAGFSFGRRLVEVHFLGLAFGLERPPLAIRTPFGRLASRGGVPDREESRA